MNCKHLFSALAVGLALTLPAGLQAAQPQSAVPEGFTPLFNGQDFSGWNVPKGDNGHWRIIDGVIDYDARSEAPDDKNLWTAEEYGDFVLRLDWRIKETPYLNPRVPIILPDGSHKKDASGKEIVTTVPDSDSGIFLRGEPKSQVNIWCWPVGSGEVYGYRMDEKMSPEVRAGVTPKRNADRHIGEWNTFEITMKGERLTVRLNGQKVLDKARLPGIASSGRIGLQHHGSFQNGQWTSPPALVQFRNIAIKRL